MAPLAVEAGANALDDGGVKFAPAAGVLVSLGAIRHSRRCTASSRFQAARAAPAVQPLRSASIVAVSTSPETARARSPSEVTKTSACSCVSATNSASYVVSQPN
jgi:hypothetical protein